MSSPGGLDVVLAVLAFRRQFPWVVEQSAAGDKDDVIYVDLDLDDSCIGNRHLFLFHWLLW